MKPIILWTTSPVATTLVTRTTSLYTNWMETDARRDSKKKYLVWVQSKFENSISSCFYAVPIFIFRADFQKFDLVKLRIYNYYYLIIFLADLNYKSASFCGITSNFWLLQIRRKSVARRSVVLITHFFPPWLLVSPAFSSLVSAGFGVFGLL